MVIDDLADRQHDCDILLDQNFFKNSSSRYTKIIPISSIKLLGPKFALLRNEFYEIRQQDNIRSSPAKRILVLLGGVDKYNITGKVLSAIQDLNEELYVDVVIGNQHPAAEIVIENCKTKNFSLYIQPNNIAELMAKADVSIGSAGSTSWERCSLGLPTICFTQADNQIPIAENLECEGVIINGGNGITATKLDILIIIKNLIYDSQKIKNLSSKSMALVDAMGVKKVSDVIYNLCQHENYDTYN
jgi:UDP-2,4-diacetamido-2,4,6-trideoxy-beta-L-altropyranose hydrolase